MQYRNHNKCRQCDNCFYKIPSYALYDHPHWKKYIQYSHRNELWSNASEYARAFSYRIIHNYHIKSTLEEKIHIHSYWHYDMTILQYGHNIVPLLLPYENPHRDSGRGQKYVVSVVTFFNTVVFLYRTWASTLERRHINKAIATRFLGELWS